MFDSLIKLVCGVHLNLYSRGMKQMTFLDKTIDKIRVIAPLTSARDYIEDLT